MFWEGEDALVWVGGVAGKGNVCGYGVDGVDRYDRSDRFDGFDGFDSFDGFDGFDGLTDNCRSADGYEGEQR